MSGSRCEDDVRTLLRYWRAPGWHCAPHMRWAVGSLRRAGMIEPARAGERYSATGRIWIVPTPAGLSWPDWRQYAGDWHARGGITKSLSLFSVCRDPGVHHVTVHSPCDWRARIGTLQILAEMIPELRWSQHSVTQFRVLKPITQPHVRTEYVLDAWVAGRRIDWDAVRREQSERTAASSAAASTRRSRATPERGPAVKPTPLDREARRLAYRERERERKALAYAAAKGDGLATETPEPSAPPLVVEDPPPPIIGVDDHAARLLPRLRPYVGTWATWVDTLGTMSRHPRARLLQSLHQLTRAGYVDARAIDAVDGESRAMLYLRVLDRGRRYAAAS